MNKGELIDSIANSSGESKKVVGGVVDAFINQVQDSVKNGEKVTLPGFGTFERRQRSARTARNPRTGEEIQVAASQVPAFKAGQGFKNHVK